MILRETSILATVVAATLAITPAAASDCDICSLPPDPGPCRGICPRYFYNAGTGQCEPFIYGCCLGNANNFLTLAECEAACPPGPSQHVPAVSDRGVLVMLLATVLVSGAVFRSRRGTAIR